MQESGFGGLQTYPGEQPQSELLPVSCGVAGTVFNGAAQVTICEIVALLRMETGEGGDVVPVGCVAPIIEAITEAIPAVLSDDGSTIAGDSDCNIDTVAPGPVTVTVWADTVNVVMKMLVIPGWVKVIVVPACVIVVGMPGRVVVIAEVIVEAGIITVVPGPVTVRSEPLIVVPGSVIISPGLVTVVPGTVIVVKDPEIDVVIVLAA